MLETTEPDIAVEHTEPPQSDLRVRTHRQHVTAPLLYTERRAVAVVARAEVVAGVAECVRRGSRVGTVASTGLSHATSLQDVHVEDRHAKLVAL